jgi:hypothetical protein
MSLANSSQLLLLKAQITSDLSAIDRIEQAVSRAIAAGPPKPGRISESSPPLYSSGIILTRSSMETVSRLGPTPISSLRVDSHLS